MITFFLGSGFFLLRDPCANHIHHILLFFCAECSAFWNLMVLFQASTTTSRRRMLCDEYRMITPRGLFSIIHRKSGRQSLFNEVSGMFEELANSFLVEVINFLLS